MQTEDGGKEFASPKRLRELRGVEYRRRLLSRRRLQPHYVE